MNKDRKEFYSSAFVKPKGKRHMKSWLEFKDECVSLSAATKPKCRHRRSMRYNDMSRLVEHRVYVFTREAKTIGRRKHGKWLYMPKRIVGFVEGWD